MVTRAISYLRGQYNHITCPEHTKPSETIPKAKDSSSTKSKVRTFVNRFFTNIKSATLTIVADTVSHPFWSPYMYLKKGFFKTETAKAMTLYVMSSFLFAPLVILIIITGITGGAGSLPLFILFGLLYAIGAGCFFCAMGMFQFNSKVRKERSDTIKKVENKIKNVFDDFQKKLYNSYLFRKILNR